MAEFKTKERKIVSPCYDHLGGKLGEALFKFLIEQGWIKKSNTRRDYTITENGWKELNKFGIDTKKLSSSKRKIITSCVERSGGNLYEHTGAYLGALLTEYLFDKGWLSKKGEKSYEITEKGLRGIKSLGIDREKLESSRNIKETKNE